MLFFPVMLDSLQRVTVHRQVTYRVGFDAGAAVLADFCRANAKLTEVTLASGNIACRLEKFGTHQHGVFRYACGG
jgi:hypothetical protein